MKYVLAIVLILSLALFSEDCRGIVITNNYSPLNRQRSIRRHTDYIILHTTEASQAGSLNELKRYGEAHYLVGKNGHVYRIINKNKIATHAGRSMWKGRTNLDTFSIGIEVVGYHNKEITSAQYKALRELIAQLQEIYKIPDEDVLPHSMVAYGSPNRWHRYAHRGRKRCGMLFAKRDVRKKLGLDRQPTYDPDVKSGRLRNADPYLAKVLYGSAREQKSAVKQFSSPNYLVISAKRSAWDIARDRYDSPDTTYIMPDGRRLRGDQIKDWKSMKAGTRVILSGLQHENAPDGVKEIGRNGKSAADIAGADVKASTTIYFLKDGRVRQGNELTDKIIKNLPDGTRMLVGYVNGGYVRSKHTAYDICGSKWNLPSTFYRLSNGSIVPGTGFKSPDIPPKTMVFFQR